MTDHRSNIPPRSPSPVQTLEAMAAQVAMLNQNVSQLSLTIARALVENKLGGPLREIVEAVSRYFDVSVEKIRGPRRSAVYVTPRWTAIYLGCELTGYSLSRVGRFFHRDHTSVIHALRSIDEWRRRNDERVAHIVALRTALEPRIAALVGVDRAGPEIAETKE